MPIIISGSGESTTISSGSLSGSGAIYISGSLIVSGSNTITNYGSFISNESGDDYDFRVESVDETHMFFIEGSSNRISMGDNTGSPGATLEVKNHASAGAFGVPLVQLNSNDTDQQCLDINAGNITANVVNITANDVTTARVLAIGADGLTTGNALYVDDNSADTGTRNTALIIQNNSAAIAATALTVQSDGGITGIKLDKNFSGSAAATVTGLNIDLDKITATTSDNTMYGLNIDMDNTAATNGTNTMYGLHVTPTLTHAADAGTPTVKGAVITATGGTNGTAVATGMELTSTGADTNNGLIINCADGGTDIQLLSSADTGDLFSIATTTHGATTITTVDDNAEAADLTFTLDGAFDVNANQEVAIDSTAASITVGAALADGQTLKLGKNGAVETIIAPHGTAGSELYSVTNTAGTAVAEGAAAVQLLATAGGVGIRSTANLANAVNITADGGTDSTINIFNDTGTSATDGSGSIQLTSDVGRVEVLSGLDASKAIYLHADAGTSESIYLHSDQGTGQGAITLKTDAGGTYILANKASAYGLSVDNNGGNANRYVVKAQGGADDGSGTTHYFYAADGDGDAVGSIKNVDGTFSLADASDRRLKKNIVDTVINGLEIVGNIKVRDFDWIKNDIHCVAGLVAQELQAEFAPAADGSEDQVDPETGETVYMTVSRDVLVPVLIKAVQELTARVAALEAG